MSIVKYSDYKKTIERWVTYLPEHWQMLSGKRLFKNIRNRALKTDEQLAASQAYGVIPQSLMIKRNDAKVMLALKGTESFRHVDKNDFVISLRSFEGGIEHSEYTGCVSPAYTVLKPEGFCSPEYYRHLLKSDGFISALQSTTDSLRDGKSISYEQFGSVTLPCPPLHEQTKIAQFLDYETAKIDALIDEQKRLIELLKEKRQAVISHAVTKGLNPDVPMKDSGVEWLGDVPEHWEVSKIKWKLKTTSGGTPSTSRYEEYYEGEIPWIRTTDLNNSLLFETEIYVTQKAVTDTSCRVVPKSSVLIAMYGGDGTIGKHSLLMFAAAINQAVCALLPSNELRPKFLHDYIEFYRPFWMIGAESSRKDPNIGQDRIGDHFCLVPPVSEQVEIEKTISDLKRKYDSLQRESVKNIKILKERRSALISAAVTGKIDVRDWQPPEDAGSIDSNAAVQTERQDG